MYKVVFKNVHDQTCTAYGSVVYSEEDIALTLSGTTKSIQIPKSKQISADKLSKLAESLRHGIVALEMDLISTEKLISKLDPLKPDNKKLEELIKIKIGIKNSIDTLEKIP